MTTITDSTGAMQERYTYDVYGTAAITDGAGNVLTVSGQGNRFLFTGRELISQIGIYDYRNRVYSATLGRFLQTDPIRFQAGDINIYRYVGNGPVNGIDPSGECQWESHL
ncbi:MAG: RHS repeat-associated core domain-containing protein [Verrucomicrobia bacterium]|nr:RHS repeat-associated core domain-containing protein [Verrucomicrobiota bacterium]